MDIPLLKGIQMGITLAEYNRRWGMIMQAHAAGILSKYDAIDAIRELTSLHIWR